MTIRVAPWAMCFLACASGWSQEYALDTFQKKQLTDKFYSEGASFGDFNHDGHKDVVSGPYWYAGPLFAEKHEIYAPQAFDKHNYSENFFCWGSEITGDGWDDVLVVGFPGKEARLYINPKDKPGPWPTVNVVDIVDNESPGFVDITGDGRPELVCSKNGQYFWAGPDPAEPTKPWKPHWISERGDYQRFTHGLGTGDVNGDGRIDLIAKDGWWEQPSAGSESLWKKHPHNFSAAGGSQMFAYDFDGDGDNDVLTSLAAHAYGLAWYENIAKDGQIVFVIHKFVGDKPSENRYGVVFSQLHAVDLVDIDGDGVQDIITGKRHWAHGPKGDPDSMGPAVLYWFRTVRSGKQVDFVPYRIDDNSGVGTQVLAGDVTGDGLADIVVGNKLGTFLFIHERKKVSKEVWEKAQPTPRGQPSARAQPTPRVQGSAGPAASPPHVGKLVSRIVAAARGPVRQGDDAGIAPADPAGQPLNLGFESGDLSGWLAQGDAFKNQPIAGDTVHRRRADMQSRHVGKYWVGTYERSGDLPRGTLTSKPFRATHPYASFLVGGGATPATRVEVVLAGSNQVIAQASGENIEDMRRVVVDLTRHQGQGIYLRLVDDNPGGWGHINFDDFRFHASKPKIDPMADVDPPDDFAHHGLDPEAAARAMTVPAGFQVKLFAGEPDVRQPIAMTIDARGRLWIAENYSYPFRVPEAEAKDRILIFEDADGDGRFDSRKIFAEKLNMVSGIEVGFGGVFVGAAPHFLFIPDRDGDDRPDGPPEVLLDGWGLEDTHETLNSFNWGPDGWLYGCHGVFTHSKVGRPGDPAAKRERINAGIWRYHPTTRRFEVFAHGTSNPWGVDFNDRGQCFLTCCVIPHLFHIIQGARYERQAGQHFNPFNYDDIKTIARHRHWVGPRPHLGNERSAAAGGGHAHAGAMLYLGDAWPTQYRDQIFMHNIHGARVNQDLLTPHGSGYRGDRAPDFLLTNDKWSQMLALRTGPDGQVYVIDWYDANQCHVPAAAVHDRRNGRIYKICYGNRQVAPTDLAKLSDEELARLQTHPNDWQSRTARRLLSERFAAKRPSPAARRALSAMFDTSADDRHRLRALWTLHGAGGVPDELADKALGDPSPYVRGWMVQLLFENRPPASPVVARLVDLARRDPSPIVRLYLASAAQRLLPRERWDLLAGLLAHPEDAGDHNLPLMYWYALEPLVPGDPPKALALASQSRIDSLLRLVVRRTGELGTAAALDHLVRAMAEAKDPASRLAFLEGTENALAGRRQVPMPAGWPAVAQMLAQSPRAEVRDRALALSVTFGDPQALARLRAELLDESYPPARRRLALESLVAAKDGALVEPLISLMRDSKLRGPAIRALAAYDDSRIPAAILAAYATLGPDERRDALNTLAARAPSARLLLEAVQRKQIASADLSADLVRQLRNLKDERVSQQLGLVWGVVRDSPADKARQIADYRRMLSRPGPGAVDASLGRAVFQKHCAQCHVLFGSGGQVGPELTGANRKDLDYILSNVLDPSAVMPNAYVPTIVATTDGRVVTGIVKAESPAALTLITANETLVVPKNEIESRRASDKSMMPDDLWNNLRPEEVRSLVAYLASPVQVPIAASAESARAFFNGKDLAGWNGDPNLWSVEAGEIVGKSQGIRRNEFLKSDLAVKDFRLSLKVRLVPNTENSGIQFRSELIEGGLVKGYQADIGAGWWGKLYEEHGRELLWNKPGDSFVRVGDWNDYVVEAIGPRIRTWINEHPCVDLNDPAGAKRGIIALQIHAGGPFEVRFKDLRLEIDPKPLP